MVAPWHCRLPSKEYSCTLPHVCMQSYMDMASQGLRPSLEDEPGLQSLPGHQKG
jgi:hypothetical protein